jgi:HSP20 family protein
MVTTHGSKRRYFATLTDDESSEEEVPQLERPTTLQRVILHPNRMSFHQNTKRILDQLNQPRILHRNQTTESDDDSSSESVEEPSEPKVEAVKEKNRNPNLKTSNNNEPADNKSPTSTIPEPSLLVDSSSMAAAITADVKEYRESYVLEMDMAGLKSGEIKVEVEDDNVIVISGERKREFGVKYLRMERRVGNLMRKFVLPENANSDAISAVCQDGLLSVTVQKKLLVPQPNKTRTIEVVRIA